LKRERFYSDSFQYETQTKIDCKKDPLDSYYMFFVGDSY